MAENKAENKIDFYDLPRILRKRKPSREESIEVARRCAWDTVSYYHRRNLTVDERRMFRQENELALRQRWEMHEFGRILTVRWFPSCHRTEILTT